MAWGNAVLCKKNSKFESFLKRTISEETFERVRAYESCIVVSEKENKAFKFVVLTDECLYLTENPPKTIQEAVNLKDVTGVELVNEYPDFLTGSERTNTQHIAVRYVTLETSRRRSLRRGKKSPRGSMSDLQGDRSNMSTPQGLGGSMDSFADDTGYMSLSTGSLSQSRPTSRGSTKGSIQSKKKKKPAGLNDSLDHDSILRSLKEEIEEDMLEDIEEDNVSTLNSSYYPKTSSKLGTGSSSMHNKFSASGGNGDSMSAGAVRSKKLSGAAAASDLTSIRSNSQQSMRPLPPLPKNNGYDSMSRTGGLTESEVQRLLGTGDTTIKQVEEVKPRGCLFFKCCGGNKNQVVPICKGGMTRSKSEPDRLSTTLDSIQNVNINNSYAGSQLSGQLGDNRLQSRNSSLRGSRCGTPLLDGERNINELNGSSSDLGRAASFIGLNSLSVDGLMEKRKCVLNIYLLNTTSPLLMLIRSAWNNYIMKSTIALEPEHIEIPTDTSMVIDTRDKVERKYNKMKRELFQPNLSMEQIFSLVDQLLTATRSNFTLKKLFWKNSDVFSFLISQLTKYMPKSDANLTTDEGKAQRADEIELVILILTLFNVMFRESEILPTRLQCLRQESGKMVCDLLQVLMSQPDLPYQPLTLTKHWSDPLAGGKKGSVHKNVVDELSRLKTEYHRTAIASVFELFLVARQAPPDDIDILSVTGVVAFFRENKAVERFVDRLLSQIMELVSLSRFDQLTPCHALQVFQMFTLLQIFLEEHKSTVVHVRNNYYEEFKYFIQAPAVSRKLPLQYPITATTITIIDQVVAKVLDNKGHKNL